MNVKFVQGASRKDYKLKGVQLKEKKK